MTVTIPEFMVVSEKTTKEKKKQFDLAEVEQAAGFSERNPLVMSTVSSFLSLLTLSLSTLVGFRVSPVPAAST